MKTSVRPPAIEYRGSQLCAESVPLRELAGKFGTPLYVYAKNGLRQRYQDFDKAFRSIPHTVCYAIKANSNLAVLRMYAQMGSGFDIVSGGELQRVRRAARKSLNKVVFSGVGKTVDEMDAALAAGILMFNVESESELKRLAARAAAMKMKARIALRVNPDVFARTHPYISTGLREHKFGIAIPEAARLYVWSAEQKWLEPAGVSVHIGSQITDVQPFAAALQRTAKLVRELRASGINIRYVDAGGGLGIPYKDADSKRLDYNTLTNSYARAVTTALHGLDVHLLLEPGRVLIAPCGTLLTRVLTIKQNGRKRFLITDAGMNDLIRPALYSAYHSIVPVKHANGRRNIVYDIVGPVCETGDFFARDRRIPELEEGEYIAILDVGAYGMVLSSNYNSRGRAAEVLVDGKNVKLIRKRETGADLMRNESL